MILICYIVVLVVIDGPLNLEIRKSFLFCLLKQIKRQFFDLIITVHLNISADDVFQFVQKPFVNLGQVVNLIYSVTSPHCLRNHENTLISRFTEFFVYIIDFKFLIGHKPVSSLAYHPQSLLQSLFE